MGNHHQVEEVRNPGSFETPGGLKSLFLGLSILGAVIFAIGLKVDSTRAWSGFLINHFYFLSLGIGGLFFVSLGYLTQAMWLAPIRRVSESFTAYLPFVLISFAVLYFGMHDLYPWTHPEHVKGDVVLEGKASYLNVTFFVIRNIVAIFLWIFFAKKMVGNSIAQDAKPGYFFTGKNRTLTPVFLMVFALSYSMAAIDSFMSLDPHWFSTMFAVYCFSGMFYSTLALVTLLTIYLKRQGKLQGIVNENHLHDMGKFMFAFTVFYAYIAFCQYMLIWYANLPEETFYYINRTQGNWLWVSIFLIAGKFGVPFFMLIRRGSKRSERRLIMAGIFMLIAHWIDFAWLVQPQFFKQGIVFGWMEAGITAGFVGIFGMLIFRFLAKNNVVAMGDPYLKQSVFHHHQ